jgi:uncharacterized membrane protein YbhN (UPF0104 family)
LLTVLAGVVILVGAWQRNTAQGLLTALACKLPDSSQRWVHANFESLQMGLASLRSWHGLVSLAGRSLCIWASSVVQFWVWMPALGLHLSLGAALAVVCVTSLGMVVPSSPGYLGIFEYLTVLTLAAFEVPATAAMSYALVVHGSMYAFTLVLGLTSVVALGVTFSDLRSVVAADSSQRLPT